MRHYLFSLCLCSALATHAQTANVGVNTRTPEVTLDVLPSKPTGNTNEGIRAPQLTKTRIAAIVQPKEGTFVYAKAESASVFSSYTGSNAAVRDINERGYYFYDGTKWVKANDEWEYDGDKLRVRTYSNMNAPRTDLQNVFITDDGRVGIGTRNPDKALEVNGDVFVGSVKRTGTPKTFPYAGNLLAFEGGNNFLGQWGVTPTFSNSDLFGFYRWDISSDKSSLRLILGDNINQNNDYLSIGGLPCWQLAQWPLVDHNTSWYEYFRFTGDGQAFKSSGGNTWNNLSDVRTKEKISNYTRGLSTLMKVRPVNYQYRPGFGSKGRFVGVLAQELEQVDSTMVINTEESRNGVDHIKYVDSSNFTYMLINAVKELKHENDVRRAENETLRHRLDALEQRLKRWEEK